MVTGLVRHVTTGKILQRQKSPSLVKTEESKDLEDGNKYKGELQSVTGKVQKDVFGATILPQNLSFENAKKLSENQVRLEDIPLVNEDEAAEVLAAEKMKAKSRRMPRSETTTTTTTSPDVAESDRYAVVGPDDDLTSRSSPSPAEMFWIADPYDSIPGPKIFRGLVNALKQVACHVTIVSLFRFVKRNRFAPFKAYGPIVKMPEIAGGKIVVISRPEHILAVFEQDRRPPSDSALDSIQWSRSCSRSRKSDDPFLFHTTEEWESTKKAFADCSVDTAERYFDDIDEAAEKFIRRIRVIRNGQNETPGNFLFEINKWSLECLCSIVFDRSLGFLDQDASGCSSKSSQLLYSLTVATKKLCSLESGFQFWRFVNTASLSGLGSACSVLESIISEYVVQVQLDLVKRRDDPDLGRTNNLSIVESLLLRENVTPGDVVVNLLDILLVGMNTMSSALAFLLYHFTANPRTQESVWREVTAVLPEKYNRLEYESLGSFKYVQACLKESLRLKMPIPVLLRFLTQNVTVNNYQIPKGTFVLMTAQVECMKEDNFDDPTDFQPERWLEAGLSHPFVNLPLGHYFDDSLPRRLAELSVWVCAALIVRHFSVEYTYGDIEATSSTISFPNKPLKFTFTDRRE